MPGCGEEDEYLGRGGSLEDGDLYLCWNNCPGLAVVTCHHFTSIHRKLSQLEGIQFHPGKVDICRCQRVILQSESGPRTDHGGRRLTCRPSASLLRHGNCKLRTGVRGNPCHSTLPRAPQSHGPPAREVTPSSDGWAAGCGVSRGAVLLPRRAQRVRGGSCCLRGKGKCNVSRAST